MKLEVRMSFSHVVGKWLALRYTHSKHPVKKKIHFPRGEQQGSEQVFYVTL